MISIIFNWFLFYSLSKYKVKHTFLIERWDELSSFIEKMMIFLIDHCMDILLFFILSQRTDDDPMCGWHNCFNDAVQTAISTKPSVVLFRMDSDRSYS